MTISIVVADGDPIEVASNKGWGDFLRFARKVDGAPNLLHLATYGWDDDGKAVAKQVKAARRLAPSKDVQSTCDSVAEIVRAGGAILVSQGLTTGSDPTANAFCPTGPGGGVDPTCGKDEVAADKQGGTSTSIKKELERASEEIKKIKAEIAQVPDALTTRRDLYDEVDKVQVREKALKESLKQVLKKEYGVDKLEGGKESADKNLGKKDIVSRLKATADDKFTEATDIQQGVGVNLRTATEVMGEEKGKVLSAYVFKDLKPTGETGEVLEQLIQKVPPSVVDLKSYRGMRVPSEFVKELEAQLKSEGSANILLKHPSSFTNSPEVAHAFAKAKGYRASEGDEALVMEVLIPKGTKVAGLNMAFNVGWEHVVSGEKRVRVVGIKRGKTRTTVTGVLEDRD